jgi:radical SAM superfamily enzyme YgiQ (UPF0313 family)
MKVVFAYPPFCKEGRYPLIGQNRQFRYSSSSEVRIFPLIPASSVTLLSQNGFEASLIDGANRRLSDAAFDEELLGSDPDVLVLETKTPLMPRIWSLADELKKRFETVILVGDHVTALPRESLERCPADYVLTGGDYDLSLLGLVRHLAGETPEIPGGTWYEQDGESKCTGLPQMWSDLDAVPFVDRDLTNWASYGEAYLKKPCAYILTGRGCGGTGQTPGECSFCSWQHNLWNCTYRVRSPANVADELQLIVEDCRPREVFDDNESGMAWNPEWLADLKSELSSRGILDKVALSSNARADSLSRSTCRLLASLGFRLLKVGVESGNPGTLQRIGKMETVEAIERGVENAKNAGLRVLLTVMVGYPWEGETEVRRTYRLIRQLLRYRARIGDSLQASILIPYPGTPLHAMAMEQGLFTVDPEDYDHHDMSQPVLEAPVDPVEWCGKLWQLHYDPVFLMRCLASLSSTDDLGLAAKGVASLLGHSQDFEAA